MDTQRLKAKVALITGASRGIGRAIAVRFAAEGAHVAINHYHDAAAAAETLRLLDDASLVHGHTASHSVFDVDIVDADGGPRMVDAVAAAAGRLDVLVNNAGLLPRAVVGEATVQPDIERVLAVNLTAAMTLSAAALRHFLRQSSGTIINTTSVHDTIPKPGYLAYAVSKAGLGMLTRTLALEYADRGIRVNAVGPGAIETAMNEDWLHDRKRRADVLAHIPMGRAGLPDDIAAVYAFLASDEARYITGQTIYACGGLTLHADFQRNWSS